MKGVNNRLILVALSVLMLPPLLNVVLVSFAIMMTPIAGFEALSLAEIGGYVVVPLIYLVAFALAIFRYRLSCDGRTIAVILMAGSLLFPAMIIMLKVLMVPDLVAIYPSFMSGTSGVDPSDAILEYPILFRNNIIIGGYYLGFCASLFLTTYSENRTLKALIFVLGGIALGSILSLAYVYAYFALT